MDETFHTEYLKIYAEPLHKRAAEILRKSIIEGKLAPGEQISEINLCNELGISRTPIREALKFLETEGLVTLLPRRGAIVTEITFDSLKEMFEIAILLEINAVKVLCEIATEKDINSLKDIYAKLASSYKSKNIEEYILNNELFHKEIIRLAGNNYIKEIHNTVTTHLRRARYQGMAAHNSPFKFFEAHKKIITAIKNRDVETAQKEISEHQQIRKQDSLEMLSKARTQISH